MLNKRQCEQWLHDFEQQAQKAAAERDYDSWNNAIGKVHAMHLVLEIPGKLARESIPYPFGCLEKEGN